MRDQVGEIGLTQDDTLTWTNLTLDYSMGRHLYMSLSAERSSQGIDATDQYYATTHYRF